MYNKLAFITGIIGPDRVCLTDFLLQIGYDEVFGIKLLPSSYKTGRTNHLYHGTRTKGISFYLPLGLIRFYQFYDGSRRPGKT